MNKKWMLRGLTAVLIVGGLYAGQGIWVSKAAESVQPGSAEDPLVTKSYLEEQLRKWTGGQVQTPPAAGSGSTAGSESSVSSDTVKAIVQEELNKAKQEWQAQLDALQGKGTTTGPSQSSPSLDLEEAVTLTVLKLEPGQILYGGVGTELIVRSGKTIAVSNSDGIPDVTAGVDVVSGTAVENNHLLVIPREGRGIKAASDNTGEIYVMVRGIYVLLKDEAASTAP